MTSHELARLLLAGEDCPVRIYEHEKDAYGPQYKGHPLKLDFMSWGKSVIAVINNSPPGVEL